MERGRPTSAASRSRVTGSGWPARYRSTRSARVGYDVREICGRKPGETLSHSKQRCRAHFVAEGYTLIANVGNRSTDFTGGNYERAFRLPSYGNALG